jgi:ABC-2 type transport system ATP-binding protein
MTPTVELRDIRKSYGDVVAVDGLSLSVAPGSVFGLLGPNGAGKTTTLRMLMDILAPDSGRVLLFGRQRRRADLARIGYLPEERGLYRRMTVIDHLLFFAELHGLDRRSSRARIEDWLERVGLRDRARRRVEELSKGMQQKIQLIGTMLHEPELLILDEPFSGLDPINQSLFKDLLAGYKRRGKTLIFSTHIMEQAEKLCDDICLIAGGRAALTGALAEIKGRFGSSSYRLIADGDLARAAEVPGVDQVISEEEGGAKLLLAAGASGPEVLRELVGFLDVREFRSSEPGLDEIFVKVVGDGA